MMFVNCLRITFTIDNSQWAADCSGNVFVEHRTEPAGIGLQPRLAPAQNSLEC